MNSKYYERKLNDVIMKCPIEAGVEILVYNVLDSILNPDDFSLVDINNLQKGKDERLTTDSGISDIAVLSPDFEYKSKKGKVYGFIETKAPSKLLTETEQIIGQKTKATHYLYTNGLVWKYFKKGAFFWEITLAFSDNKTLNTAHSQKISIKHERFEELINNIRNIKWNE